VEGVVSLEMLFNDIRERLLEEACSKGGINNNALSRFTSTASPLCLDQSAT
jgi:hypothetical protein